MDLNAYRSAGVLVLLLYVSAGCGGKEKLPGSPATARAAPDTGVDGPIGSEVGATPSTTSDPCTVAMDGAACDDRDGCTTRDVCQDQRCVGLDPVTCAAAGPCQMARVCEPTTGMCGADIAVSDGTACNDGDACTSGDNCRGGACVAAATVTCAAGPCELTGRCDPVTGACSPAAAAPDGTGCDDGDRCTTGDRCRSGQCHPGAVTTCSAPACRRSACDPTTGACRGPVAEPDGTACEDDDLCTASSTCLAGTCVGSQRASCGQAGPCSESGSCDPKTGKCVAGPVPDGRPCDDGNACTINDFCQAGTCRVGSMVSCPPQSCREAGSCDPGSGRCLPGPVKVDGGGCDDGNLCTRDDSCRSGVCIGGSAVICTEPGDCRSPGSCEPTTGVCRPASNKPDGTSCDDGDLCTQGDQCRTGNCIGGPPLECRTSRACETSASCSRQSGQCQVVARLPVVQRPIPPIPRSETLVLRGTGLLNARVILGDKVVGFGPSSDTQLTISVAADHPLGPTALVVRNECGEDRLAVDVVPHPPLISSVEPATPAPDGVLRIRADFADRSQLLTVQIGNVEIPTTDASRFAWPNPANANDVGVIGVRVPPDAVPGAVGLRLVGRAGASNSYMLNIKSVPAIRYPPTPSSVLFTSGQAEDDDIFPIVRNGAPGPFFLNDPGADMRTGSWVFLWRFQDLGVSPECIGSGAVNGFEKYCTSDAECWRRDCVSPSVCHPLRGTWQLNSKGNLIDIEIDRTSSGGVKEKYRGAWRSENSQEASVDRGGRYVVLHSVVTGRQISIGHQINKGGACNHRPYPWSESEGGPN